VTCRNQNGLLKLRPLHNAHRNERGCCDSKKRHKCGANPLLPGLTAAVGINPNGQGASTCQTASGPSRREYLTVAGFETAAGDLCSKLFLVEGPRLAPVTFTKEFLRGK
jgi:hypothetical protein